MSDALKILDELDAAIRLAGVRRPETGALLAALAADLRAELADAMKTLDDMANAYVEERPHDPYPRSDADLRAGASEARHWFCGDHIKLRHLRTMARAVLLGIGLDSKHSGNEIDRQWETRGEPGRVDLDEYMARGEARGAAAKVLEALGGPPTEAELAAIAAEREAEKVRRVEQAEARKALDEYLAEGPQPTEAELAAIRAEWERPPGPLKMKVPDSPEQLFDVEGRPIVHGAEVEREEIAKLIEERAARFSNPEVGEAMYRLASDVRLRELRKVAAEAEEKAEAATPSGAHGLLGLWLADNAQKMKKRAREIERSYEALGDQSTPYAKAQRFLASRFWQAAALFDSPVNARFDR